MIEAIEPVIQHAIAQRIFPGCVAGIVNRSGIREIAAFGRFTYEQDACPMFEDAVFDVASVTKSIPTSSLALKALEEGNIRLDSRVIDWVPELSGKHLKDVLLLHLLTHTLNFNFRLSQLKDLQPAEILERIYTADLKEPPGTTFFYCNATSILLGICVERIFQKSLSSISESVFFEPLGMNHTGFNPRKFPINSIVPTEIDPWRKREIRGEIHDESAWVLNKIMTPGAAGLFSCASDLLNFLEMLLNFGSYKKENILKASTVSQIPVNHIQKTGECTGLGWELNQKRYMGRYVSQKTIGKTGFTGCFIIADMERGVGITLLSNYTYPSRKSDHEKINSVRRNITDLIFSFSNIKK